MTTTLHPDLAATYHHPRPQLVERREVLASVAKDAGLADA
jgi:hypothetical protein